MSWKPINTAPRVRYRNIKVRLGPNFAPYHVTWDGSGWTPIEFINGGPFPSEWFDEDQS